MTKKAQALLHQNQTVEKKKMAPIPKKTIKKSVPVALAPPIASDGETTTKKTPMCGAGRHNVNSIARTGHANVSAASTAEVSSGGVLLRTPSAAVYYTPNHGNKSDLVASAPGSKEIACRQAIAPSATYAENGASAAGSTSNLPVPPESKQVGAAETQSRAQDSGGCDTNSGTAQISKPLLPQATFRLQPVLSDSWPSVETLPPVFHFKDIRPDVEGITPNNDIGCNRIDSDGPAENASRSSSAVGGVTAHVKSGRHSLSRASAGDRDHPAGSQSQISEPSSLHANNQNKTLKFTLSSLANQAKKKGDSPTAVPVSEGMLSDLTIGNDGRTGLKICIPPLGAGGSPGMSGASSQPLTRSRRDGAPRVRRARGGRGGGRIGLNASPTLRPTILGAQSNSNSQTALQTIGDVADVGPSRIRFSGLAQQGRYGNAPHSPMTMSSSRTQEVGGNPVSGHQSTDHHQYLALHQGKKRKLDRPDS